MLRIFVGITLALAVSRWVPTPRAIRATRSRSPLSGTNSAVAQCNKGGKPITGPMVTCTRIHRKRAKDTDGKDVKQLEDLIHQAKHYSDHIAIAVDEADALLLSQVREMVANVAQSMSKTQEPIPITVLPISIWGNFVAALNALLFHAASLEAAVICYTSVELEMSAKQVAALRSHLTEDTCLVGALVPGQDFSPGRHVLTGGNSPWNTFALWSVAKLTQVGFMPISEGVLKDIPGGVEEGPTVAVLQMLQPDSSCCKLIDLNPPPKWHTDWTDPKRQQWHREKMESKVKRTTAQMKTLRTEDAFVDHIKHDVE